MPARAGSHAGPLFVALASRRQEPQSDAKPGGPGWRLLGKSSAPRHESSDTPTRDAASDARFEGKENSVNKTALAILGSVSAVALAGGAQASTAANPSAEFPQPARSFAELLQCPRRARGVQ